MKHTPKIFGFPLWKGPIKRRIAKKYLVRFGLRRFLNKEYQAIFSEMKVGDWISDCSGRNNQITQLVPAYYRVGNGRTTILGNVDITTTSTGCSLNCGIEPKLSRERIEAGMLSHHKEWTLGEGGKTWYGHDTDNYRQQTELAQRIVAAIEAGQHVVDEDGHAFLEGFQEVRL